MRRSERLQAVTRLARTREERIASDLAALRRAYDEQSSRLAELERFQRDYADNLQRLGRDGLDAQRLRQHLRFGERLGEATVGQRGIVAEVGSRIERMARALAQASARRQALEKVMARLRAEEARHGARREQREADDRAARQRVPID